MPLPSEQQCEASVRTTVGQARKDNWPDEAVIFMLEFLYDLAKCDTHKMVIRRVINDPSDNVVLKFPEGAIS
jgi:hypothetical protein